MGRTPKRGSNSLAISMEILAELPHSPNVGGDTKHAGLASQAADAAGVKTLQNYWESSPFWGDSHSTGYTREVTVVPSEWASKQQPTKQLNPVVAEVMHGADDLATVLQRRACEVVPVSAIMVPAELEVPAPFQLIKRPKCRRVQRAVVFLPRKIEATRPHYVSEELVAMEPMSAMEAVELRVLETAQTAPIEARRPKCRAIQRAVVFKSRKIEAPRCYYCSGGPVAIEALQTFDLVSPVRKLEPLSVAQAAPRVRCVSVAQVAPTVVLKQKLVSIETDLGSI